MPFVKLDCGILDSSLWPDANARIIFLTALLMAEPYELRDKEPQLKVSCLEKTGWVIPSGWYGMVPASCVGIINRAGISLEAGMSALERLCSHDLDSRSDDFEGRRLARVNGGYIVLNFQKYRDRDYTGAERQARYRAKVAASRNGVTKSRNGVTERYVTQAEAEAEAEAKGREVEPPPGFPENEKEAVERGASAGASADTCRVAYHNAVGRGYTDSKGVPIRNWAGHVKAGELINGQRRAERGMPVASPKKRSGSTCNEFLSLNINDGKGARKWTLEKPPVRDDFTRPGDYEMVLDAYEQWKKKRTQGWYDET